MSERKPNRLIDQTSPYLLQHAHNPVDWYPWGEEALQRAKAEDKPILLSIGYAACHWCHVMERESFEDAGIAALMNEHFVCIKVDREERPDIDSIYMDAVQAMTGHGGWPMTMFLAPSGEPFFGGTYFPPEDRQGMPGFPKVLHSVVQAWQTQREQLLTQGRQIVEHIAKLTPVASNEPLTSSILSDAARQLAGNVDPVYGGFGRAPKFPQAPTLEVALRLAHRGIGDLRGAMQLTLSRMALGGICDQLGGGFHRYAVDQAWLVPHFEKMLYDNAQLARVYLHAWQAYKDPLFRRIALETLGYLVRDMRSGEGGFFASEDADSEGEEGRFYVWTFDEVSSIAPDATGHFGVTPEGNFEGVNILTAAFPEPPEPARTTLLQARSRRVRPALDDKVLASWNGLTIAALAEAGAAFGRPDLLDAARAAADFVLAAMRTPTGRLLHSYRDGRAAVTGMLEDYAYLADGLLELWQATFERRWLDECTRITDEALELFRDERAGGFHSTGSDHEKLILRSKEVVESATPSPGAVLSMVLQRLGVLLDRPEYTRSGLDALRLAHLFMSRAPQATATWLQSLDFYLSPPREVAFVGDLDSDHGRALRAVVTDRFLPSRVLAGGPGPTGEIALLAGREPIDGRATAFVCERRVCKLPTADPAELARQLDA